MSTERGRPGPDWWRTLARERLVSSDPDSPSLQEVAEELAQDLEQRHEDLLRAGADPDRATERVRHELATADLEPLLEAARRRDRSRSLARRPDHEVLPSSRPLDGLGADLRLAARRIRQAPGAALLVAGSIALGVGAGSAIFTVADALLLRALPFEEESRVVHLFERLPNEDFTRREGSYPDFLDWSARTDLFDGVGGYNGGSVTLSGPGGTERVRALEVTEGFFPVLGIEAARGRLFEAADGGPEPSVAVLGWSAWQTRFGGDPGILGRVLTLNERPFEVVGILPPSFRFALRGEAEIWLPLRVEDRRRDARSWHWLDAIARLRDDVSLADAERRLESTSAAAHRVDPEGHRGSVLELVPLREEMVGRVRPAILALCATALCVLGLLWSNLAGLLLLRGARRRGATAVRLALGAGAWRLRRPELLESGALLATGAGLGAFLGWAGTRLLIGAVPEIWMLRLPHLASLEPEGRFGLVVLGVTGLCSLPFLVVPELARRRSPDLASLLRTRGRIGAGTGRSGPVLVALQIALSFALVAGASLVGRSFLQVRSVSPGFEVSNLLTALVALPQSRYADEEALVAGQRSILRALESEPGFRSAASTSQLPLTGRGDTGRFRLHGRPADETVEANLRFVSEGYFGVAGIPTVAGRTFELEEPDRTVIVNETLARRVFGGDAVGRRLSFRFFEGEPWWTVVGVVGDERVDSLDTGITPIVYFSLGQVPSRSTGLVLRTDVAPGSLEEALRRTVRRVDPQLAIDDVRSMEALISGSPPVFLRRSLAGLTGVFGIVAVLLTLLGVFGVLATAVEARRRELGLRVALGASPRGLAGFVLSWTARITLAGVASGFAVSAGVSRVFEGLLYGVEGEITGILVLVALALVLLAGLASAWPVRRALAIEPARVLRDDAT